MDFSRQEYWSARVQLKNSYKSPLVHCRVSNLSKSRYFLQMWFLFHLLILLRCFIKYLIRLVIFAIWHFTESENSSLTIIFPGGTVVKNLPASSGDIRDTGSIPESGRAPGGGHGNPLQHSCLENPMDRGDWQAMVQGVAKSRT